MRKNLRFGIVGAGRFGRHYVRILQEMDGVILKAIADPSQEAREVSASTLPEGVRCLSNFEEVVGDPEIDCIVVAAPPSRHFLIASHALLAGKHTLVEKPMTATLPEAYALRDAVEKSNRVFMVGHQYLYNDYVRELKTNLERGVLGRISYIFAQHFYPGPIRSDIGCFWETATHELSMIDYLFSPNEFRDVALRGVDVGKTGRDDLAVATFGFGEDVLATIAVSWLSPDKNRWFMIGGNEGTAVFNEAKEDKLKFVLKDRVFVPQVRAREPLRNELEHFLECIDHKIEPLSGIAHGLKITEFLEQILSSMKWGGLSKIDKKL